MKGFMVVNRINEVLFIDTDSEFSDHINKQAVELGLLQDDDFDSSVLDPNMIMQLFSPLFMSQWMMIDQRKNPCISITCDNDFMFVFKHVNRDIPPNLHGRPRRHTSEDIHITEKRESPVGTGRARSKSCQENLNVGKSANESSKESSNTVTYTEEQPTASQDQNNIPEYRRQTVFLTTEICQYSPHQLHCIQIYPGIVLVLISEISRSSLANNLCQVFILLKDLLSGKKDRIRRTQGLVLHDMINTHLNRLSSSMRKAKFFYLQVSTRVNFLNEVRYLENFPGLVHFIYVDRKTNQITAPALNIVQSEEQEVCDATQLLKDKIWKMVEWMQIKLKSGITMVTAKDGDYHYSYFLWFEDCSGNTMTIQQPFQPQTALSLPGILCGNFYSSVTRQCFPNIVPGSVNCYEMLMMHVGLTNHST
ncbi:hypothetical protein KUTeg_004960 [Tegillarca granosa]|uniref:FUZ/MON1/HPS1 third Longin domain-containing protein n=1 Tax=Tegillarca granosa TaxID=220873 RepID=A0ABQ9FK74_TEGGR|nr:hypothetical protein KUTeg_004960 [Tegillarca granosa]